MYLHFHQELWGQILADHIFNFSEQSHLLLFVGTTLKESNLWTQEQDFVEQPQDSVKKVATNISSGWNFFGTAFLKFFYWHCDLNFPEELLEESPHWHK